ASAALDAQVGLGYGLSRETRENLLPVDTNQFGLTRIHFSRMSDAMSIMFHDGNRQLQDRFDSRRISDRLEEKTTRNTFSADDKAFIEGAAYFFLATADVGGRPDCSFKGGMPGFVRVTDASELAFPDYDGNGMFKSLGNVIVNPHVGLLFIA